MGATGYDITTGFLEGRYGTNADRAIYGGSTIANSALAYFSFKAMLSPEASTFYKVSTGLVGSLSVLSALAAGFLTFRPPTRPQPIPQPAIMRIIRKTLSK